MGMDTLRTPLEEGPLRSLRPVIDTLWARLAPHGRPREQRRILFTAPEQGGQGTTTVAACAALGLARHLRSKVCLVEARAPSEVLAALFGLDPQPGLSEVLAGEAQRVKALRMTGEPDLVILPAGTRGFEPGALVTEEAHALFRWLADGVDFLLVDAPAVHLLPEVRPLLWEVEQAVVVAEAGKTRKDEARTLVEALAASGVEVLGSALTGYRTELPTWIGGGDRS